MRYAVRRVRDPLHPFYEARILALDELCFPTDEREKVRGAEWWLVETIGGAPGVVGYAGARIIEDGQNGIGATLFLCRAGVLPCHRGEGLHRRLIRARERFARSIGCDRIVTYTVNSNPESSNNLIRLGYKLLRPRKRLRRLFAIAKGAEDVLYWQKEVIG